MRTRRLDAPGGGSQVGAAAAAFSRETLRREGDRYAKEIESSIVGEVADLPNLPPGVVAGLVKADLDRAADALSERRPPSEQEMAVSAATAADLARRGVPIDAVLRLRRVAIRRAGELLREAGAAAGLDPDAQVECIYRMWEWADAIQAADAEAHRSAALTASEGDEEERAVFVRAVLQGALPPSAVAGRAAAYGLVPGSTYRAFRARAASDGDVAGLARAMEASGADRGSVTAVVDGDLCGVVTRPPEPVAEGVVGLGPETDLARLDSSFAIASRALEAAVAFSLDGVVTMDDLSLRPAIISEGHLGERLVSRYLDPLRELGEFGATLETTVREYLGHGMRIDETAKALYVHPNTLRHRLDRFQQLTGADLRNTENVLEIWWALQRRALEGRLP